MWHNKGRSAYLLDDIGAELLNGQSADVTQKLANDSIAEPVVVEIKDVLHDIVAVRILDEGEGIEGDLVHELNALVLSCMIDTALKYAAAVAVSRNLDAILSNSIVDELCTVKNGSVKQLEVILPGYPQAPTCSGISE